MTGLQSLIVILALALSIQVSLAFSPPVQPNPPTMLTVLQVGYVPDGLTPEEYKNKRPETGRNWVKTWDVLARKVSSPDPCRRGKKPTNKVKWGTTLHPLTTAASSNRANFARKMFRTWYGAETGTTPMLLVLVDFVGSRPTRTTWKEGTRRSNRYLSWALVLV